MGDEAPTTKQTVRDLLRYLGQYAPEAIQAIGGTVAGTTQQQLAAEQGAAPGYQELNRQNQLAASATEADIVEGPGSRLVGAADKYQRQLDPEFYSGRSTVNDALDRFIGDYDPSRLSPTEVEETARGIAATGGPVTSSNLNTVKNAMVFGDRGQQRWQAFGDAVTKAASVLPTLKSGISGFDVARARTVDTGARDAVADAMAKNYGFSSSALSGVSGLSSAAMAKRKDVWDKLLTSTEMFSNVAGGAKSLSGMGSDERLKDNIAPFDDGLAVINKLTIKQWDYNDKALVPGEHSIGVVAQEVQDIMPYIVGTSDDGMYTVNPAPVIWVLVNAVKELSGQVEKLKNQVSSGGLIGA